MRFFRDSLDDVLMRLDDVHGIPELLWPDGRWVPDPGADLMHRGTLLGEDDAKAFAEERSGTRVDLRAPALTNQQHAAELCRLGEQTG